MPSATQWNKCGVQKIENFTFADRQAISRCYPQYYHKTDKEGRPIYIERLGKANMDGLNGADQERLLNHLVLSYEEFFNNRLPACKGPDGSPVTTCCTIMDLEGIGFKALFKVDDLLRYLRRAGKVSDGYPKCTGKFYIINAPSLFSGIWKAIKPLLSDAMVDKIHVVSEERVKEVLLSEIPAENLPVEFGGRCQCPGGCSSSDAGPWNY